MDIFIPDILFHFKQSQLQYLNVFAKSALISNHPKRPEIRIKDHRLKNKSEL